MRICVLLHRATIKRRGIMRRQKTNKDDIKVENIDVSLIDENESNDLIFNMDRIDELANSIKKEGFFGAINVCMKPDKRYEVVSGHRRLRAVKKLGRTTIPCIVYDIPDDINRGLQLLSSNIRARILKPMDWARSIQFYEKLRKKAKKESRINMDTADEYFCLSRSSVSRYNALNKLIPELQEYANNPDFAYSSFAIAGTNLNEDEQRELLHRINEQLDEKKRRIRQGVSNDIDDKNSLSRTQLNRIVNDIIEERARAERKKQRAEEERAELISNDLENSVFSELDIKDEDDFTQGFTALGSENNIDTVAPNDDFDYAEEISENEFDTYTQEIRRLSESKLDIGNKQKIKSYIPCQR